ncbi:MAG TPA: AbrB/MazE/SpoVT family DNA-binding domain-containing protein [Candidatus Nanoarchaeia archaeon]|nr:AbrB/MazE/SpoVT family DNA-binding domain-containing protein [Candidatus Nanoarchaeia archaeon]
MITAMSKGYQITIPASWRKALNIEPGTKMEIEKKGKKIVITPFEPLNWDELWKEVDASLKKHQKRKVSTEEIVKMRESFYDIY